MEGVDEADYAAAEREVSTGSPGLHERLFLILIPFSLSRMREETRLIIEHYSRLRPHQGLTGRTPDEVYFDREPAIEKPRWEPRAKWPQTSGCAAPYVPVKGERGARLELEVRYLVALSPPTSSGPSREQNCRATSHPPLVEGKGPSGARARSRAPAS